MTPNVERQTGETWHLAEGGNLPGRVWFRLTPDGRGGLVCTECAIEADRPLTTTVLRSVPLTLLIEELLAQPLQLDDEINELVRTDPDADLSLYRLPDSTLRTFYMANAKKPAKARPKNRRGGPGPTDDELERFAAAYRWARGDSKARHSPVKAAAERMSISRATAHRWLKILQDIEAGGPVGPSVVATLPMEPLPIKGEK